MGCLITCLQQPNEYEDFETTFLTSHFIWWLSEVFSIGPVFPLSSIIFPDNVVLITLNSWPKLIMPGYRGVPFFGIMLNFAFLPHRELMLEFKRYLEQFEGILQCMVFGFRYIFCTEPEFIQSLLSSSTHIKKDSLINSIMEAFLHDGLLLSEGEKWRYRRKLLTPAFHFKILENSVDNLNKHAQELANNFLKTGGNPVKIDEIIRSTTIKAICETAMAVKLDSKNEKQNEYVEATKRIVKVIVIKIFQFWAMSDFLFGFTKDGRRYFKDLNTVHTFTKKVIADRRKNFLGEKSEMREACEKKERKPFLDYLLELNMADESVMSEEGICEEVDTFMFEVSYLSLTGSDTVSACLTFTMFLLANHPEVQEKVAEEMFAIFGQDDRPAIIHDLNKMVYLEMVIKESLRLYPSVPFISRTLTEDLEIRKGLVIPSGYNVCVCIFFLHRSEKHWECPEEFKPERFSPGIVRHPYAFIPFSAGPRNCIGQKFAMMELKTILSAVVRKCTLEAVTKEVVLLPTPVLSCENPIIVKILPRNN